MTLTYIFHSGFVLETEKSILIFDYWLDLNGVVPDMAEIKQVMDAAKAIMRQSGNKHQWSDGYPSEAVITVDMERNGGLVIKAGRL